MGDRHTQAQILDHLGDVRRAAGNPRAAADAYREALIILIDLNHLDGEEMYIKLGQLQMNTSR